ncbi:hypothetical protein [Microbacterium resistens]|uniref:hypothetical protein n=1 Tax=Microbacterium resistens TaxID=156977 RepID=UPI00366D6B74
MANYLVSYDLVGPKRDYDKITKHMLTYTPRMKPLESVWIVGSNKTAGEVRDDVKKHVDPNDMVLVIEVRDLSWGTSNIAKVVTDVMKSVLQPRN